VPRSLLIPHLEWVLGVKGLEAVIEKTKPFRLEGISTRIKMPYLFTFGESDFTREALCIRVGQILRGEDVVDACNRLVAERGAPARVFVDNGSEFSGRMMDLWAYHHGVQIDFSRPGKPTDNSFVESFNGSFRDECLNVHWFEYLEGAREKIETSRIDYNDSRPHQGLRDMTPTEFALKSRSNEFEMVPQQAGD
jgi:transposase InsO family protein